MPVAGGPTAPARAAEAGGASSHARTSAVNTAPRMIRKRFPIVTISFRTRYRWRTPWPPWKDRPDCRGGCLTLLRRRREAKHAGGGAFRSRPGTALAAGRSGVAGREDRDGVFVHVPVTTE